MARRSTRRSLERLTSVREYPDSLPGRFEPLDDPGRLSGYFPDDLDQYVDLIHTDLIDSGSGRGFRGRVGPVVAGRVAPRLLGRSPAVVVRASLRTRSVDRRVNDPLAEGRQLAERALACARRSIRREVLFAMRRTGRGAGSRRRRRNDDSKWRC